MEHMASVGSNVIIYEKPYGYEIAQAIKHERYVSYYDFDIGLLRTVYPIQFSEAVWPIALPRSYPVMSGVATIVGYGITTQVYNNNYYMKSKKFVELGCYIS